VEAEGAVRPFSFPGPGRDWGRSSRRPEFGTSAPCLSMAARDNIENGQCRARIFNRIPAFGALWQEPSAPGS